MDSTACTELVYSNILNVRVDLGTGAGSTSSSSSFLNRFHTCGLTFAYESPAVSICQLLHFVFPLPVFPLIFPSLLTCCIHRVRGLNLGLLPLIFVSNNVFTICARLFF
jgi:hypothetical protein